MLVRVGTAGWTIPRDTRDAFPAAESQLARYAQAFSCVEINSTFYRPHRKTTYERWAAITPQHFAFSLKAPKTITHERRLVNCGGLLRVFLDESAALETKRAMLLVQLPPSFAFDEACVSNFFSDLRREYVGPVACEPRHASWFELHADQMLSALGVARVAADPALSAEAARPGGSTDFAYYRWHGTPRPYYSAYEDVRIAAFAALVATNRTPRTHTVWCIFDNTALGAATRNALDFQTLTRRQPLS